MGERRVRGEGVGDGKWFGAEETVVCTYGSLRTALSVARTVVKRLEGKVTVKHQQRRVATRRPRWQVPDIRTSVGVHHGWDTDSF